MIKNDKIISYNKIMVNNRVIRADKIAKNAKIIQDIQ